MDVRFAQLNIDKRRVAAGELRVMAEKQDIGVLLVQEPYVDVRGRLPGYGIGARVITGCGGEETPWAAVVILDPAIEAFRLAALSDSHCVVVQTVRCEQSMYLVSMYCQVSHELVGYLDRLRAILRTLKGEEILIAMDSNARSPLWGDSVLNGRGKLMEEFLEETGLRVLNDGKLSTFCSPRGESYIDLTLATGRLRSMVQEWKVEPDWTTGFHRVIWGKIMLRGRGKKIRRDCGRFSLRSADWKLFRKELVDTREPLLTYILDGRAATAKYEGMVTRWIRDAAEKSMKRGVRRAGTVRWWSKELDVLKKEVLQERRRLGHAREEDREICRAAYRSRRALYKKRIKEEKERSWEEFAKMEMERGPWNRLYKMAVGKIKNERAMDMIGEEVGAIDWKRSARLLLDGLVRDDDEVNEGEEHVEIRREVAGYSPISKAGWEVSMEEVRAAVWTCRNGKAPGWDGITAEILKEGWSVAGKVFVRLYSACIKFGVFPDRWKWGIIRALLKSEDKDPKAVKSYRPICLLPVMGKVLERIIVSKMEETFVEGIHRSQHGYMRGRGTETAMREVGEAVKEARAPYVLGIFLDLTAAFDRLWWPGVLRELKVRGVKKEGYDILKDYLRRRKVELRVGGNRVRKDVNLGCPQGSVLGPQLWKLIFDGCVRRMSDAGLRFVAYADDGVVLVEGKSRTELEWKAMEVLEELKRWMDGSKKELSREKTVGMLLKGRMVRKPDCWIGGEKLKIVERVKYLGVVWENQWRIGTHMEEVARKAHNVFCKVLRMFGERSYCTVQRVYNGLYVPIVCYAVGVWGQEIGRVKGDWALSLQRRTLLRMIKGYRTISTDAVAVLAGVLPLDLEIRRRWAMAELKRVGRVVLFGTEIVGLCMRGTVKRVIEEEWQRRWTNSDKGRHTFAWIGDVAMRLSMRHLGMNYYVTQALSGHGNFKAKLMKFQLCRDSRCVCGAEETAMHVVLECGRYEEERRKVWKKVDEEGLVRELGAWLQEGVFETFVEFVTVVLERKEREDNRREDRESEVV